MKREKGITLIALVITIIVLLILAGVAISMLSGENGILTRAVEAKEKTEEAQQEEETNLASMELETYFIINDLKYKCAYGCVTGINVGEEVSKLQTALQAGGYELKAKDGTDNFTVKNDEGAFIITTGLLIEKDNKTIAKTVIFGDVDGNGEINILDASSISNYLVGGASIDKRVADVDRDGEITNLDAQYIANSLKGGPEMEQNQYVLKDIEVHKSAELSEKYCAELNAKLKAKESKYEISLVYFEEWEDSAMILKGVDSTTKVSDILEAFEDENIVIKDANYKDCGNNDLVGNEYSVLYKHKDGREIDICLIYGI